MNSGKRQEGALRVLHLCRSDSVGGAAIAARRLHLSLLGLGVDSQFLCLNASGTTPRCISLLKRRARFFARIFDRCYNRLTSVQRDPTSRVLSLNVLPNGILRKVCEVRPDVLHIHWVGGEFFRVEDIPKLPCPLVWSLHDMWAFCGAEHCTTSNRWKEGYSRQNRPPGARGPDLNRWVWERKRNSWNRSVIHTIAVSRWIQDCVQNSELFRNIDGVRALIGNGIDVDVFECRQRVTDSRRQPIVAFGAAFQEEWLKGGDMLPEILDKVIARVGEVELVTFGAGDIYTGSCATVRRLGLLKEDNNIAKIYQGVDILMVPSRIESFGLAAAEAMSCGVPVVCFDTSGLKDVVVHRSAGYRAKCFDLDDFADGVAWCLQHERYAALSAEARRHIKSNFTLSRTRDDTLSVYREALVYNKKIR